MKVSNIYKIDTQTHTQHTATSKYRYSIFDGVVSMKVFYKWLFTSLKLMTRRNIPGAISGDDWTQRPGDQGLVPE